MKNKVRERFDCGSNTSNGGREAARVVIIRGAQFSTSGRRRIAAWLRREATFLERHADEMDTRYTARWMYHPAPPSRVSTR